MYQKVDIVNLIDRNHKKLFFGMCMTVYYFIFLNYKKPFMDHIYSILIYISLCNLTNVDICDPSRTYIYSYVTVELVARYSDRKR